MLPFNPGTLCWLAFTAHLFPANHCSMKCSACSLPIWERMQLIAILYVATSTYLAPHPTRLIAGWPSFSTQPPSHSLSHITIIGKFSGFLLSTENCFPRRFDILKTAWQSCTFLILIHLTAVRCFQTSPPSIRPKYLNYFGQCRTNHHHLITSRYHF